MGDQRWEEEGTFSSLWTLVPTSGAGSVLYIYLLLKRLLWGWGCCSVIRWLLHLCKALLSVPSTKAKYYLKKNPWVQRNRKETWRNVPLPLALCAAISLSTHLEAPFYCLPLIIAPGCPGTWKEIIWMSTCKVVSQLMHWPFHFLAWA